MDWRQVALAGAIGGVAGGGGAAAGVWIGGGTRLATMNPMLRGAAIGGGENVVSGSVAGGLSGGNVLDPRAMAGDFLLGGGVGTVGGRLGAGRLRGGDADVPQMADAPRALPAGPATGGTLRIAGSGFSASELRVAQLLYEQGKNVVLRQATGLGRTSDLLLNGIPYDVYSATTGSIDRIVSAIASKGSQVRGGGVVIDLSGSPLSSADLANVLPRVQRVSSRISDMIVIE